MSVRVAVVGAGWWSRRTHLPVLQQHPDADIAVVCDADRDRAEAAAQAYGATAVGDVDGVLSAGVDAAIVATPHDQHAAQTETLVAAGIDVLVEKPMTLDPAQAWRLVEVAEAFGARLHTGFTYVHGGPARAAHDLLRSDGLGRLTLIQATLGTAVHRLYRGDVSFQQDEEGAAIPSLPTTYSVAATGGGQMWAQTVHAIAMLLWMSGLTPHQVVAIHDHADGEVDVSNALSIKFSSGAVGSVASSGAVRLHTERREHYTLIGGDGHARLDTVTGRLSVGSGPTETWPETERNPVDAPARCLVDACLGRAEVLADGTLGAWTTAVAWAAAESARIGGAVDVPGPAGWERSRAPR